jgi:hypothetical protein
MVTGRIAIESKLQFRSKSLVCYNIFHPIRNKSESGTSEEVVNYRISQKFRANVEKLKQRKKYTGEITPGAKKRLTKAISLLVQSAPERWIYNPVTKRTQNHKISFITLTLPDVEAAKDAKFTHKYLLQPMLRILRNKYKMCSYVWKAELQKNESIHYHITTELFMPWEQLRQHWNALLRKNGLLEAFQEQYGHNNPNSVDIHSVNKVNDLEAYLVKYVSKEYQNSKKLAGKVWDCSKNLKASKYFVTTVDHELHQQVLREIDLGWLKPVYRERCVILRSRTTDYYQSFSKAIVEDYYKHLNSILTWEKNTEKTPTKRTSELATGSSTLSQPDVSLLTKRESDYTKTFRGISEQLTISSFTNSLWRN